jgi:hypothetical protein
MDEDKLTFYRLTKESKHPGIEYSKVPLNEYDSEIKKLGHNNLAFNMHYEIINHTGDDLILGGSLRTTPTIVPPVSHPRVRPLEHEEGNVIIKILHWNYVIDNKTNKTSFYGNRTTIIIKGRVLNHSVYFIDELDLYLGNLRSHPVMSRFIEEDSRHSNWDKLDLVLDTKNHDPSKIYMDYKRFSELFVDLCRHVQIRVRYRNLAEKVYVCLMGNIIDLRLMNRVVEDPTLEDDEFIIEFLRQTGEKPFYGTFTELNKFGSFFIDQNEIETANGKYVYLGIFKDQATLSDYIHKCKSKVRFDEEYRYLAEHSGDKRLHMVLEELRESLDKTEAKNKDYEEEVSSLKKANMELVSSKKMLEREMKELKAGSFHELSADKIRLSVENEHKKLTIEQAELDLKGKTFISSLKSTMVKNRAETIKNVATIISVTVTTVIAVYTGWKKMKALMG